MLDSLDGDGGPFLDRLDLLNMGAIVMVSLSPSGPVSMGAINPRFPQSASRESLKSCLSTLPVSVVLFGRYNS